MDNQDKKFDKFKDAAQNAELKEFPAMEKIWSRVEEKLDKKEDKNTIALWKKVAVAASLLLLISLGYQFLHSDKEVATETQKVVIQETEKSKDPVLNQKNTNPSSDSGLVSNEEAVTILENQTKNKERVALQEIAIPHAEAVQTVPAPQIPAAAVVSENAAFRSEIFEEKDSDIISKDVAAEMEYKKENAFGSAKMAASSPTQKAKKSTPLVVLNGNAMAHSDDAKKDKMMQSEMSNLEPENVDSLVILDDPLYIVDGIYYSENDLFGKNPTSPYAPLDKQEIKTITILQDLEATEKYGDKGKKGVVIITTKNGKPTPKK